jgi:cytidylate kinase
VIRLAIDGPAASGKSAVGSAVAAQLNLPFVDTGIMYRAITWLALQRGVPCRDAAALSALASGARIEISAAPAERADHTRISVDGLDATPHLRDPEVERNVSSVSAVAAVRTRLVQLQRQLAAAGVVMAGRDIGSVVIPDAELKVYLDASPEERARRRQQELQRRGEAADYETLLAEMRRRDHLDSSRAVAPLRPAPDAVHLVTDGIGLDAVVRRVLQLVAALPCDSPGERRRHGDPGRA